MQLCFIFMCRARKIALRDFGETKIDNYFAPRHYIIYYIMELPPNFEYFEKNTKIDKLIREQDLSICQNRINAEYIKSTTQNYLFGFIHKSPIAQMGQKKKKSNQEHVYSFILCDIKNDFIIIHLICSRQNIHYGKKLIELAQIQTNILGYKKLALHSILDDKLVRWYKSQGFKVISEINFPNTDELKCYFMVMNL